MAQAKTNQKEAKAKLMSLLQEAGLDFQEELKLRTEFERETREKRIELQKMEQRLNQKDEILDKKDATL